MTLTQINKAGLDELALDHVFTIGASGSNHYTFQGEGLNGTVNDPTLYLTRGKTYRFENGTGAHPIRIQSVAGASGTAYNTGVTNNAGSGTVIVEVQHDAPDVLYYQCTSHAAMNGILYITGALADGGVTTAKLADDAVTDAKLANSINSAITANTAKNTNATHTGDVTGSSSLTIASNAVTTAKIADEAVTLAKLPHGDGSSNGKFLRANNGADPTFETVSTDLVADTSPQLGGNLDTNDHHILLDDNHYVFFGDNEDLKISHDGTDDVIHSTGTSLRTRSNIFRANNAANNAVMFRATAGGNFEAYYDGSKKLETISSGIDVDGSITCNDLLTAGAVLHEGDTNTLIHFDSDDNIAFKTNGTVRARINNNGLCFNADTAAANALDGYEEGSFLSYFECTNNSQTVTYNSGVRHGHYTKIGNKVTVVIRLIWTSKSGSGNYNISNLPFTASADGNKAQPSGLTCHYIQGMYVNQICGYLIANSTKVRIGYQSNGSFSNANFSNVSNSGEFNGVITYLV